MVNLEMLLISISRAFSSGSGSSDGAENGTGEKLSAGKLSEFTSPSPGPSGNSYTLLQTDNVRNSLFFSS